MTVRLRNISPLGAIDVPALGRTIDAGEEFDCPDEIAGSEPKGWAPAKGDEPEHLTRVVGYDDDGAALLEAYHPGAGLLAGLCERVAPQKSSPKAPPTPSTPTPAED